MMTTITMRAQMSQDETGLELDGLVTVAVGETDAETQYAWLGPGPGTGAPSDWHSTT
jgi:hypothetical protein